MMHIGRWRLNVDADDDIESMADALIEAGDSAQIIVGTMAQMDANYSVLVSLASALAESDWC